MGEVIELVFEGVLCKECGCLVDTTAVGYPRTCEDCDPD